MTTCCNAPEDTLRICEIFYSLQGESSFAGQPCVFVRLSGCNLRCAWCDTTYAYAESTPMSIDEIVEKVESFGCELVEITGGEPMMQEAGACKLMAKLLERQKTVLLETNGSRPLDAVPQGVHRIIDLKPRRAKRRTTKRYGAPMRNRGVAPTRSNASSPMQTISSGVSKNCNNMTHFTALSCTFLPFGVNSPLRNWPIGYVKAIDPFA